MAKQRTDKSRVKSNNGSQYVTDAQHITEQLCIHIAKQQNKELGDRFWLKPEWAKVFREQIPAAVALLKKYHLKAIIGALRDYRCRKMYSLRAKWFHAIVKQYQVKLDAQPVVTTEAANAEGETPRPTTGEQTVLNKLRDL